MCDEVARGHTLGEAFVESRGAKLSNIVIAVVAIALFLFGILCFGLAFQVDEAWRFLTFLGGILACTAALFIPMTFIGRSNRSW
ncbi:hypothetical protein GCM10025867_15440 [Frondihabitans sucicola]|uniref:Uncharacterized protein n=1 Tax=Frondihabitans sucicola TaxID=1268041 RepID=A0ABM8GLK8_9MICO|nr:hypothetical protein GCM10025867_15440 [Frondihabitans sucicola]